MRLESGISPLRTRFGHVPEGAKAPGGYAWNVKAGEGFLARAVPAGGGGLLRLVEALNGLDTFLQCNVYMGVVSKYSAMAAYLSNSPDEVQLTFAQVEAIVGSRLPQSAYVHPEWWSNDSVQHVQSRMGWLAAGFKTTAVNLRECVVRFTRTAQRKAAPPAESKLPELKPDGSDSFQNFARIYLSHRFGQNLFPGEVPGVPRRFDFVSKDKSVVGNGMFLGLVRDDVPTASLSSISEQVWLLGHSNARTRLLLFGNEQAVPKRWLERYGHLAPGVTFLHFDLVGKSTLLAGPPLPTGTGWE